MAQSGEERPIDKPLLDFEPCALPSREPMQGLYCRLEALDPARHGEALFDANATDTQGALWSYLPYGPFEDRAAYLAWLRDAAAKPDPLFFTVIDARTTRAAGLLSLMRMEPQMGVIEVGHIAFSPGLQRTPAATEALFLVMQRVFDELGYRRLEWKCNALNEPSRRAAERFGFRFEGVFRQHMVVKRQNRDTAWYALLDHEWPANRTAFESWLAAANFDGEGRQIRPLRAFR